MNCFSFCIFVFLSWVLKFIFRLMFLPSYILVRASNISFGEVIQDYFSRVSQFKEQLEEIGDNLDEGELIMIDLNGLTRPWDAFIQTICARKEKLQFDILWEECVQEESRAANRESLLSIDEDQALSTHSKEGRNKYYF